MHGAGAALLWACLFVTSIAAHNVTRRDAKGGSKRVVCYYTNWSVYRPGTAKFNPQNINPYLCTHLIYAFGGLTRENGLRPYDKYQDIEQGGYAKFTGLKTYNKQLKTMLAIGGWNEGSTRFSPLVASSERRVEFVKNVVRFLRQNHFDGLDLDWEYPAFRDGGKPRDRDNYALLVQELREEFDRESSKTGRPRLLLTMAVPAGIEYIDKGYDIPKLNRYLDFMNILSYDYHSSFEPSVNHHSPLYPLEEEGEYNFDAQLSIDYTINHYLKLGADRDKLVLGIPTYGRSYTLFNPDSTEIGAPADGPGEQGDATREKGYLAYYEICENLQSTDEWKVEKPNPRAMGPYAYRGNQWVGYDDEDIVKRKARYVTEMGLGGIMYWAIDNDDFRGKCHGRPYPLIEAGKEAMLAGAGTANELDSPSKSKTRPKPRVTTEEPPIVNSGGGSSRPSSSGGKRRRPSIKTKTHEKHASTTTSTTPSYKYPTSTPEPPTTPDPGSDFKCEDEGFFPHPRDCKKYFWCLDSGPSNLGIVAHQFTCPSGLYFNKAADSCDYTRNVVCNIKPKAEAVTTTTTKRPDTTTSRNVRITTTTTTEAPEEEEEEYEDDEEEIQPEEDPRAIKELIDLIKKLGGIENLEKQLHFDESKEKEVANSATPPAISKKLYDRVLSQANVRGNSNANFYSPPSSRSSTPHTLIYKSRGRQNEGLENLPEVAVARQEKPQYVTIRRERPTTPTPIEDPEEEEVIDDEESETVNDTKNEKTVKPSGREYVNIRRDRPSKPAEEEVTTSKYASIRRQKPSPVTEVVEDTNDVVAIVEEVTTTTPEPVTTPVTQETPVFRKKLTAFTPRTPKTGSVLENFRRKKKEEVVEVTTVEGKEDIVTVTTETTTLKVSEASQKNGSSTLPYLEVTRGRGSRLSTTQSTLEDDLSSVNINDASTSAPQVEANNITTLNPSLTSESTTTEELISPPIETVPPTTTSEPTPLSTTTRFTPTVTRVVISESESGTTERQRISLSKYKGFYLTVSPLSPRTTVAPDNNSTRQVEKIKEVNRITEVTFRDDFSIPFTRPISLNETTTKSNQNQNNTSVSIDDDTLYSTTDPSETDSTIPDNQDNNEISFPGITKEVDTTTQQVTNASTSLSTEGRGRFRQPFRGTSTRSPLPRSQRRRTTVASTLLGEVTDSSDQVSTRRPFVPKRRGSYRPNSQTGSGEELKGSTLSQEEGVQIFSRRTTTTSTVRPDRFVPEYRSRGRTKIVESNPEEEQEVDVYEQDEPEQEVQITPVINRNRPNLVLPRSRSKISNLSQQEAIDQGQTLNPEVNRVRPSLVLPRTRVRIASPAQQEIPEQDEETNSEIEDNNSSPDPPRSRGKIVNPVEQEAPEEEEQTNSEINSDIPSQTPPRGRIVNPVQEEVYEEEDQTTPEINRDIPSRIPPRYRGRIAHPVTQEAPEEEEQINPEINRDISSRIPPRSRGRIIYPVQQEAPEEEEQINPEINIDIPSRIPARSRGRPLYVPSTPVESDIRQTSSRRPTSRFRNPTTTAKPERIYSPQQRNRERKKLVTSTEGNVDELVSQQTLSPQSVTLQEETATPATPRDTTIRSRTGQRVVKKIKKRLLNGTTTTSDPTTSHTTAPLSSSTLEELQYESKKLGADAVTPIPPTETYQDPSTLDILDGVTQSNTVYEDELTATPTPNEDYGTAVDIDGQQFVTYAIVPQDEVLETQFSSSSVDVSDRGAHKFSLGDVLLAADDDSVEPKLLKILPPRTFKSRVTTRTRQRVPQDTTNESNEDFKNSLGTSSETGQDISRVPGYKRKTVIKRKRLPDQLASTSESDDVEAGAQGEVPSTTARTFLRRRPENSSFYSNSRLRSRPTTSTTTTAAPLPNVRPSRRQQTPASRLAVSRRRKYGSDANSTATAAGSASTVSEVAATEPIVTTLVTGEPEIITAEPGRKFSFPRRRTKPTPITQTINDDNNNTENVDGKNNDSNNNNKTKSITLTVKAALHHVIDSQNEPSTVAGAQANLDDAPSAVAEETSTALPDLANGAVVAIHNLVTIPTRPSPRRKTYFETSSTPYIVATATTPRRKTYFESSSTPYIVATATTPTPPPRISTSATPYFPRRGSAVYVTPTSTAAPVQRGRPFSKITSGQIYPQSGSVEDFEYYDSGESIFSSNPVTGKVKIHSDGYIECLDQGNFPHPFSCKKFISCAKMENSDVLGWEYTCPRHLSFDPIGGICNWSAGLGCKE